MASDTRIEAALEAFNGPWSTQYNAMAAALAAADRAALAQAGELAETFRETESDLQGWRLVPEYMIAGGAFRDCALLANKRVQQWVPAVWLDAFIEEYGVTLDSMPHPTPDDSRRVAELGAPQPKEPDDGSSV